MTETDPFSDPQRTMLGNFRFFTGSGDLDPRISVQTLDRLRQHASLSQEDGAAFDLLRQTLESTGRLTYGWTPQESNFLDGNPESRWLDYVIFRHKFLTYPTQRRLPEFPLYVLVEPISVCNLRCVMCYQIDKTFTKKPYMGNMDLGLFRSIIDQLEDGGTRALTMAARGEPTLHPHFGALLDYVGGKFLEFKMNTNATKLTEDICHKILSSDIGELVFSIDAHEKRLYEEIRVRGNFDDVLRNVRMFQEIRSKHYPDSKLRTRVSGMFLGPEQDADGFVRFWSELADNVGYAHVRNQWDTYANRIEPDNLEPCRFLWDRMYVWFDGTCNPCELDYKSTLSPGSAKTMTIRQIWHGPKYEALREAHAKGRRTQHSPCDRCGWCSL